MITIYIALCLIWGVFFTGYMFRHAYLMPKSDREGLGIIIVGVFVISVIFMPLSIWYNLPYVIYELKGK